MSLHPLFGLKASVTATLGIGMSEKNSKHSKNKNRGKPDFNQSIH